jgi:hydroxymethyl cephem carbamoyltransferase
VLLQAFELMDGPPDVVALGGWCKLLPGAGGDVGAGYTGLEPGSSRRVRLLGQPVDLFTSSHERSHLFMVAGMAPVAPLDECVILLWEGELGAFYHWREGGRRLERFPVLMQPGSRYVALYGLADPAFPASGADPPHDAAGKLMALAAFADGEPPTPAERDTVERLLALETLTPFDKRELSDSCLYDCGLVTPPLQRAAAYMSERLFAPFHDAAARLLPTGLPLLITGGCGLNCEWNTRWRDSGQPDSPHRLRASPRGHESHDPDRARTVVASGRKAPTTARPSAQSYRRPGSAARCPHARPTPLRPARQLP